MTDDHGAIPLPTGGVKVLLDPSVVNESTPQPEAQQLASFDAIPNDECPNGKILDVNQQFVVYAVKNGLIRVLHRHSTLKALLRGHEGTKVTDIQYFNQGDVLGTVGGNVIIWRVFERSPEIVAEKLMEIPASLPNITRLKWHPFNPNQFWLFHHNGEGKTVATLVESTRMSTAKHPTEDHAICILHGKYAVMEGAIQLASGSNITDLDWSSGDARHVMTTHDDGSIRLWDIKTPAATNADGTVTATCNAVIQEKFPVIRGFFMPHENIVSAGGVASQSALTTCFCTATKGGSEITVWSPFMDVGQPTKLQVFGIDEEDAAYNLAYVTPPAHVYSRGAVEPPAFFFMLSDRKSGKIFALHLKSMWSDATPKRPIAIGFDYIVPFLSKFATFSWSIAGRPADNSDDDYHGGVNFDVLICALQTKAVQHMVVPHYMCMPPFSPWEESQLGVSVELLETGENRTVDTLTYEEYDEEYDIDDANEIDETEEYCAPEASTLPTPDGMGDPAAVNVNPFANWLGAIAAKTGIGAPAPHTVVRNQSSPPLPQTPYHTPAATPLTAPATRSLPPGLIGSAVIPHLPEKQSTVLAPPALLSPVEILSGNGDTSQKKKPQRDRSPKGAKTKKTAPAPTAALAGKITILKKETPDTDIINVPLPPIPLQMTNMTTSTSLPVDWEDSLKKIISAEFNSHVKNVADEVQRRMKSEITDSLLPEIVRTVTKTMEQSVVKPLQASMDKALKQSGEAHTDAIMAAISGSVEQPLNEAFTESMKSTLIPAYESATREIMFQVSKSVASARSAGPSPDLSAKLDTMAMAIKDLTAEVTQLRSIMNSQAPLPQAPRSVPRPSPADQMEVTRKNILTEIEAGNYETAFTKALSLSTTDMAIFCCKHADLSAVLGGEKSALSQPILLCLMQQLGAAIALSSGSDLEVFVSWLQEIALTLDPANESIVRHVPGVLQQLVGNINAKIQSDPSMRRRLQMLLQVIRGML